MKKRIENYIRAGYPGLYLTTFEESRAELELSEVAKAVGYGLYSWSLTTGTINASNGEKVSDDQDHLAVLQTFIAHDFDGTDPVGSKIPNKSLLLLKDFHLHLTATDPDGITVRLVKDALAIAKATNRVLVIIGCRLTLPAELSKELTVVEFSLPSREQLNLVLDGIAKSAGITVNGNRERLLDAASGLTTMEAENAFALSVSESKNLTPAIVHREKALTVKKNGILEIVETKLSLADVGGLEELKGWNLKRRLAFSKEAKAYGLPTPKGFLLVGIPGCGKSLTAKATANILGVPLVKLDAGKLFGSLVGESEGNLRLAIQTAEAIAPCVLWVDEVEKAFSGVGSSNATDGGTTARVFGTFISWMQEKTAPVFIVATANDITKLPPEFLRKGRFDELFFVDLPDNQEREAIWAIQIAKYGRKPEDYCLPELATMSNGWTGSEIEAVFTEALYAAFDAGKPAPDDIDLASIGKDLVPLSKTMAEQLTALRSWANGRARQASGKKQQGPLARKFANS